MGRTSLNERLRRELLNEWITAGVSGAGKGSLVSRPNSLPRAPRLLTPVENHFGRLNARPKVIKAKQVSSEIPSTFKVMMPDRDAGVLPALRPVHRLPPGTGHSVRSQASHYPEKPVTPLHYDAPSGYPWTTARDKEPSWRSRTPWANMSRARGSFDVCALSGNQGLCKNIAQWSGSPPTIVEKAFPGPE